MSLGETIPTRRFLVVDHRATVGRGAHALEQVGERLVRARDRHPFDRDRDVDGAAVAALLGRELLDARACVTRPSMRPSMLWVGNEVN